MIAIDRVPQYLVDLRSVPIEKGHCGVPAGPLVHPQSCHKLLLLKLAASRAIG
jgi:hypothetical protein